MNAIIKTQTTIQQDVGSIVSSLVKVKLRIGAKGTSVKSNELAIETAANHGAQARDITTKIKWLSEKYVVDLKSAYSRLRGGFNARTLPWEDGGYRVVPADRYQALCDFVADAGEQFHAAAQKVADEWDEAMEEAHTRLNGLMAKMDIPTRDEFINAYAYDFRSDVIVAPSDMRVAGIGDAQIERIRAQAEGDYAERITAGIDGMLAALTEMLTDLVKRTDKDKQDGVRYGSWAKRARKMAEEMAPLNIVSDERLNKLLAHVNRIAYKMDADAVRNNDKARAEVRADAVDAIDKFGVK